MPVVSRYCNICNRLITAREIESGEAIVYQTYYYCPKCKKEAMPIIEAIRRRQEREQEKEEEKTEDKKRSSTRFGTSPKHRSSSIHKLRKTKSGVFQNSPAKTPVKHKPQSGHRTRADLGHALHGKTKEPAAGESAKPSFKPSSEFDKAIGKASGTSAPAKPSKEPRAPAPGATAAEPEAIEIIGEPAGEEESGPQGMTIEEVIAEAEPRRSGTEAEDKLAASGITFEDIGPVVEEAPGKHAPAASAGVQEKVIEAEIVPVETQAPAEKPAREHVEPDKVKEAAQPAAASKEAHQKSATSKHAPAKSRTAISRFQKHVHPGKRHSALKPPEKKKPWLFIIVILLMALGGGLLIAYKQFFMPPEEESEEAREEQEEKERYALLEKEINALADKARTIAANPANFKEFSKKASELGSSVIPSELREKLAKARDTANEGFSAAAKEAFARIKTGYEKALEQKDLGGALSALDNFPSCFKDTEHATEQIPQLRAPVEKTTAILEEFEKKKQEAAALEARKQFAEAALLLEGISYDKDEVLPDFLGHIEPEIARLRDLDAGEKERIAREAEKVRLAFEDAKKEARGLAEGGKFQEALNRLAQFDREYPGSGHQGDIMNLNEDILAQKRRALLKNFFNGKDLEDWTKRGEWKVDNSEIAAVSGGEKIWLLKGDPDWADYTFEFDFNRVKGALVVVLRAAPGEPESGFTQTLSERPFQKETWYHVKCTVSGNLVSMVTSFNNQEIRLPVERDRGVAGFLLPPDSQVRIRNVSVEVKEP